LAGGFFPPHLINLPLKQKRTKMKNPCHNFQVTTILLLLIGQFSFTGSWAQQLKLNQKVIDPLSNHEIMIGYCTLAGMTDSAFNAAFISEYDIYNPNKEVIASLFPKLEDVTVTIVLGTWCSDSREQVPRFMRVFDLLEHAFPDPALICVDREKKAGEVSLEGLNILKVPTFIVYRKGKEVGRIIETPATTMENDFLEILKK
jgi:hypothetical protein